MNLIIQGLIPSKKNSTIAFQRNGRIFHFASNKYRLWHKKAIIELKNAHKLKGECTLVNLTFYNDTKRKFDLSNKAESIMDLLVDGGVIEDDNYEIVPQLLLEYGGLDKDNPRCEVNIIQ